MRLLIYLFILVINLQLLACSQASNLDNKIIEAPLCTNNKGEKVTFKNLNSKTGRFTSGVAKKDINGLPIIYRFNYQKSSKALQMFIDFHECAHHQIGDLEKKTPPQNSFAYVIVESIADCVAAIRIKSGEDNGKSLIKEVINELKKDMTIIGFSKSSIESRAMNIENCFKKDITFTTYVNNILKKRGLK